MSPQQYRSYILVPAAFLADAQAEAAAVGQPNPENLFSAFVPTSGPANANATYYGCSGRLAISTAQQIENSATLHAAIGNFPHTYWWQVTDNTSIPGQTRFTVTQSWDGELIGTVLTFSQALALVGLQPRVAMLTE